MHCYAQVLNVVQIFFSSIGVLAVFLDSVRKTFYFCILIFVLLHLVEKLSSDTVFTSFSDYGYFRHDWLPKVDRGSRKTRRILRKCKFWYWQRVKGSLRDWGVVGLAAFEMGIDHNNCWSTQLLTKIFKCVVFVSSQ